MSARFHVGDIVRCQRDTPAKGTWRNYAGRVGRVVNPANYREIGLTWQIEPSARVDSIDSWFLPSELVLIRQGRTEASRKPKSGPPAGQVALGCTQSEIGPQR